MKNNYSLKSTDHNDFIAIKKDEKYFYGGNQNWLIKKKSLNGCGPVAAANILAYLALNNESYRSLYPYENMDFPSFSGFIEELYNLIKPSPLGLTSINKFIKKILDYGKSNNVDLGFEKLDRLDKNFSYYSAYSFIRYALMRNIPVAAFNLDLRRSYSFSWHWLVITRIFEDAQGEIRLTVSSWGKKYEISYLRLYKAMSLGGGLVYFY